MIGKVKWDGKSWYKCNSYNKWECIKLKDSILRFGKKRNVK